MIWIATKSPLNERLLAMTEKNTLDSAFFVQDSANQTLICHLVASLRSQNEVSFSKSCGLSEAKNLKKEILRLRLRMTKQWIATKSPKVRLLAMTEKNTLDSAFFYLNRRISTLSRFIYRKGYEKYQVCDIEPHKSRHAKALH
ncbi:hypothetical protein [Helicobacter sp. 23-1045]